MSNNNLIKLEFPESPEFCKGLREMSEYFHDYEKVDELTGVLLVRYPDGEIERFVFGDIISFRELHSILSWCAQDVFIQSFEEDEL